METSRYHNALLFKYLEHSTFWPLLTAAYFTIIISHHVSLMTKRIFQITNNWVSFPQLFNFVDASWIAVNYKVKWGKYPLPKWTVCLSNIALECLQELPQPNSISINITLSLDVENPNMYTLSNFSTNVFGTVLWPSFHRKTVQFWLLQIHK